VNFPSAAQDCSPNQGSAGNLNKPTLYKDYLIRAESFQREKKGAWVPQYTATRQNGAATLAAFPVQQYQFNHSYPTQSEADQFALRYAREWIDAYGSQEHFAGVLPVQS
jgi:hypothetical protein